MSLAPAELSLRLRSRSPTERSIASSSRSMAPPARSTALPVRFTVPPKWLPSFDGNGWDYEQIRFIRLTAHANPNRAFALRRYTFPGDVSIKVKTGRTTYEPIPTQEKIVLSTSDADVFAVLQRNNALGGIYVHYNKGMRRAKINIERGLVTLLTYDEIYETPVGPGNIMMLKYRVEYLNRHADHNPLHH